MRQLQPKRLAENIEKIAQYDLVGQNVFGSSYAVFQDGKESYRGHFGFSDENGKTPVDDNTIFRLASMTKPITSLATLLLVDRGLISLSTPVKQILPEFEAAFVLLPGETEHLPLTTDVTLLHLLTHTSGMGSIKPVVMTAEEKSTISGMISCYLEAGLDFQPFSRQAYSGVAAFDVIAAIIEKLTGEDYEAFLKREIFTPCGMTDTTFMPSSEQWGRIIAMHNKLEGTSVLGQTTDGCVFEDYPATHKLAGAGLVSTLGDYCKFADMLLNQGGVSGKRLVSEETFSLLSTPHVSEKIMPGPQSWGLGVRVITKEDYGTLPVGSYGWSGAYGSHFWIDPVNRIVAVFMKNSRVDGGAGNQSACRFEEAVYSSLG